MFILKRDVKGTGKEYKLADGTKKKSVSKRIDLGTKCPFDIGENVAILKTENYDELQAQLQELEDTISEHEAEIKQLKQQNLTLSDELDTAKGFLLEKDDIITKLEKEIAVYDGKHIDELEAKAKELDTSKNVIIKLQQELADKQDSINDYEKLTDYKDNIINLLRNQSFIDRYIKRTTVEDDLAEPSLKTIDIDGNKLAELPADTINKAKK